MKISTRLSLGFGAAMALGLAIALTGTFSLRAVAADGQEAEVSMAAVDLLRDFKDHLHASARSASHLLILRDPALRQAEQQQLAELRQHNRALLARLEPLAAQAQTPALRTAIADARPRYDQALDAAIALGEQGQAEQAGSLLLGEVRTHQDMLFKAIDEATDAQAALAAKRAQAAEGFARARAMLMLGLAAGMVVLGGLVAWRLARSLARALGAEPAELSAALQRVADGDLAARVRVRAGDTRSTMANVARMQQTLATIVATVRGNSDSVATASAQIAQGNQDLSSRTEQQASALQQTAASMEQLGAAVRHNADHARQAKQLALRASAIAGQGGQVVAEVVTTMRDIHTSSRRIVDIISVIDGIAFQTNILALNAAVEAARAGEQGRGFAVVASEVRQLAQRSAEAAREIKQLITASVERVEQGATLVDGAGATMSEVVGAIQRVTDIVAEISAASQEQSTGVTQVGEAVVQMDHATQRNAALVEESAAAAESLRSQAQALVQAVAVFRLQATAAAAPAARKAGAQGDWRAC